MSRRVRVPATDDLFRPTAVPDQPAEEAAPTASDVVELPTSQQSPVEKPATGRTASGRVRHDEKMTVYVTSDELLHIEHARLSLRSAHGLAVDRGRLVREAVALVLADFHDKGADSALVRRLIEE